MVGRTDLSAERGAEKLMRGGGLTRFEPGVWSRGDVVRMTTME